MPLQHATPPYIAIITENTLEGLGLRGILSRMMPGAKVCLFQSLKACKSSQLSFFHYFVATELLKENLSFFKLQQHKVIALIGNSADEAIIDRFHTLNVTQSEEMLTRSFLRLSQHAHHMKGLPPEAVRQAQTDEQDKTPLTPRESEVLSLLVRGLINKEIAQKLGVGLTTVISHRKNICEKLHTRSLSAFTIYAVMHGLVNVEDI